MIPPGNARRGITSTSESSTWQSGGRPELIMLHQSDDPDALLLLGSSRLQVHTHSSLRSTVTATLVKLSEAHARRSGRLSGMSKCQALKPRKARSAGLEHRLAYTNIRRLIELSW